MYSVVELGIKHQTKSGNQWLLLRLLNGTNDLLRLLNGTNALLRLLNGTKDLLRLLSKN